MKWSSHMKITGKIGKFFGIKNTKLLNEASILPDKEYDYKYVTVRKNGGTYQKKVRLRHHLEPFMVKKIMEYTLEARRKKVKRKDTAYIIPLGKAAHYIQDNVIDPRKKIFFFFKVKDKKTHDRIERTIDKLPIPFEEVVKIKYSEFTLSDFERELKTRKPTGDPAEALRNATILTAMLIKLVVRPEYPADFFEKYKKVKVYTLALTGVFASLSIASWYLFSNFVFAVVFGVGVVFSVLNPVFWRVRRDYKFLEGDV